MVLETNPFTLCCVQNKPLLLQSRNKAKIQTHFPACFWLLLLYGVKISENYSFPTNIPRKITFKAFNPEKCYRKSNDKRCEIDYEIWTLLKLMGI